MGCSAGAHCTRARGRGRSFLARWVRRARGEDWLVRRRPPSLSRSLSLAGEGATTEEYSPPPHGRASAAASRPAAEQRAIGGRGWLLAAQRQHGRAASLRLTTPSPRRSHAREIQAPDAHASACRGWRNGSRAQRRWARHGMAWQARHSLAAPLLDPQSINASSCSIKSVRYARLKSSPSGTSTWYRYSSPSYYRTVRVRGCSTVLPFHTPSSRSGSGFAGGFGRRSRPGSGSRRSAAARARGRGGPNPNPSARVLGVCAFWAVDAGVK